MSEDSKPHSDQEFLHAFIDGAEPGWDATVRADAHEKVARLFEQLEAAQNERDGILQALDRETSHLRRQLEASERAYETLREQYEGEKARAKWLQGVVTEGETTERKLKEQFDALKRQADLDAERAAILSSAVGRARLILGDASTETTALIDAALASYPAKERDPALCRHGYDLTQEAECPLCKAQEALSEWEPARWCRRCGVYGCEHVIPAQSPASERQEAAHVWPHSPNSTGGNVSNQERDPARTLTSILDGSERELNPARGHSMRYGTGANPPSYQDTKPKGGT